MTIYVSTIIGSPAAECAHFGICQVDTLPEDQWARFRPGHLRHAKAVLSVSRDKTRLRFQFPFSGMRLSTRRTFFPPEGFRVDSPANLPEELAILLGLENPILLPGLYPLVFSEEGVTLEVAAAGEMPGVKTGLDAQLSVKSTRLSA